MMRAHQTNVRLLLLPRLESVVRKYKVCLEPLLFVCEPPPFALPPRPPPPSRRSHFQAGGRMWFFGALLQSPVYIVSATTNDGGAAASPGCGRGFRQKEERKEGREMRARRV